MYFKTPKKISDFANTPRVYFIIMCTRLMLTRKNLKNFHSDNGKLFRNAILRID